MLCVHQTVFFLDTQDDYISQTPLQLEVVMWLSSGQLEEDSVENSSVLANGK